MNLTTQSEKNHIIISVNPKAGKRSPKIRAEILRSELLSRGYAVDLLTDLDEVGRRANELFQAGKLRVLVGVGGDGTAAELTNRTLPGCPITLLPSGTANLIAKEFRLPFSPIKMARMIDSGVPLTLDAGRANGRIFLVMVSAGIDADIVERVHRNRLESYEKQTKKGAHISYFSYIKPIFHSIRSYPYPRIDVHFAASDGAEGDIFVSDGQNSEWCKWAFVFNIPRYGWGVPLVPDCVGNDRLLDFCGFQRPGFLPSVMNTLLAQMGGIHRYFPNTRLKTGVRFKLTSAETVPFQLDGDPGGVLPVEIEMIPERFTLFVPEKTAKRYLKWKKKGEERLLAHR